MKEKKLFPLGSEVGKLFLIDKDKKAVEAGNSIPNTKNCPYVANQNKCMRELSSSKSLLKMFLFKSC